MSEQPRGGVTLPDVPREVCYQAAAVLVALVPLGHWVEVLVPR